MQGAPFTASEFREGYFSAISLAAHEQQSFVLPPPSENTAPLDWMPQFPARVDGEPTVLACEQPFFAFAPTPVLPKPVAVEIHRDWILRPFLQPSQHLAVIHVPPKRERKFQPAWLGA